MTIAREWAAYCRRAASTALPADVEARARVCVADHLHAAMHGARSETGEMLRRYLGSDANRRSGATQAESSALYAGAIAAVHEIDDVHRDTALHPGSVVVAAAMAAAAEADAPGSRLLAAVATGYEVALRLSIASGYRHYHYFHATATCGTVGAAVAAAVVLGLDEEPTAHAIGMAVTSASGLWQGINDEAVTIKHLHPGMAAERGVRAAKLARLGLHAARLSIEGDKGFLAALAPPGAHAPGEAPSRDELAAILTGGLGERWAILRNVFKRYPFCLGCFEPLEGLRHILGTSARTPSDIASVLVETSPSTAWLVGQPDPQDEFQAKFSAPYALALVLAGHDVERAPLPAAILADPEVRRWISVIRVEGNHAFGRRRARVTVTLKDDACVSAEQPLRTLDEGEARARFGRACGQYLGARGALLERHVDACAGLAAMTELMPLVDAAIGRYGILPVSDQASQN